MGLSRLARASQIRPQQSPFMTKRFSLHAFSLRRYRQQFEPGCLASVKHVLFGYTCRMEVPVNPSPGFNPATATFEDIDYRKIDHTPECASCGRFQKHFHRSLNIFTILCDYLDIQLTPLCVQIPRLRCGCRLHTHCTHTHTQVRAMDAV